jgi:hypothetical protein
MLQIAEEHTMTFWGIRLQKMRVGKQNPVSQPFAYLTVILGIVLFTGCAPQIPGSAQAATPTGSSTPTPDLAGNNTIGISTASPLPSPTITPTSTPLPPVSLTILSDGDAYVDQSEPDANFGDKSSLRVDGGDNADESFIHFTVNALPGSVQNAVLRLYSGSNGSDNGPALYAVQGSWSEDEVTWNNRPTHEVNVLGNRDQIAEETWVEYDVTSVVTGPGAYTFVLIADSDDAATFSSREGDLAPELVVTFIPSGPPTPTPTFSPDRDVTLVGAGDISFCSNDNDELTAQLLDNIPGTVFTTGDNAYPDGSYEKFMDCYAPTWGRHKDRTRPIPGNHDYRTAEGGAYIQYFDNIPPYYAYDLGSWRIYALNTEIDVTAESEQVNWLKEDLAAHPSQCVLAYWHRPRWSSGVRHGSDSDMQTLWEIFVDSGAELVLNGHEHNYERFMPMDAKGLPSPLGMRQFVVGTGGAEPYPFEEPLRTSEVRATDMYGVLKLTLRANSYDWEFIPAEGYTFTDSGSAECH